MKTSGSLFMEWKNKGEKRKLFIIYEPPLLSLEEDSDDI
jgi:hypothetical protein